jgi:uncharacterized protein DUF3105
MASGTKSNKPPAKPAAKSGKPRASVVATKPKPWGTIIAIVAVIALAGVVFGYAYNKISAKNAAQAAVEKYVPSDSNKDPSAQIPGVVKKDYPNGLHVKANQRVAYDQSPPFGGPHDEAWADCEGVVYPSAVRSENMVHALEHGTVWITYNPDQVKGAALDALKLKVDGKPFMMLSPYPKLDHQVSLQSWGHQLKVDRPDDPRIDQFITALNQNKYQYPEVGASCGSLAAEGLFDPAKPPPFDPSAPGKDAIPMSGKGATNQGTAESQGQATPSAPASGSSKTTTTKPSK